MVVSSWKREDILRMMGEYLSERVFQVFEICGKVGDKRDTNTFVVGGSVRDILLSKPSLDIDIVVEGDGLEYSRALKDEIKGELKTYGTFGTATIKSKDGVRIDIASARREEYESPAVLPKVSVGNLKDDMYRRDFTINSMAIALNRKSFGELIDLFSGARDLSRGVVRVLHDKSFEDDPTRIIRAVRFETRLGFRMDEKTEKLLKNALTSRMLERLTPERKRYEVELAFSEERPDLIAERMRKLNIFGHLARGLRGPDKKHVERIQNSIGKFRKSLKPKTWTVYTIAIADALPFGQAVAFAKSLSLPRKQIQKIIQVKMAKPEVTRLDSNEDIAPSSVYRILKGLSPEGLVYMYSLAKKEIAKKRIEGHIKNYRTKRILITGDDIKRLGISEGPIFSTILEKVLDARIDGVVGSYEDEMELAKKIVEVS